MNIESLKVYCDVVLHQSFSRGAAVNNVSQSAATQSIHRLEKEFGVILVDRTKRPFVPTTEGRLCYEKFREILEIYETLTVQVQSRQHQLGGTIRVAAIYSVGLYDMSRCMKEVMKNHPKSKVRLEFQHPYRIFQSVLNAEVDLGIVSYPSATAEIEVIPLRSEKMVLACPVDHVIARRRRDGGPLDLRELQGVEYIAFDRDLMIRKETDRVFRKRGITVNIVMEFDNIETIKQAIETGHGVSVLPSPTVHSEVENGRLVAVPVAEPELVRPVGIIHRSRKVFTPIASRFIEMLTDQSAPEKEPPPERHVRPAAG